MKNFAWFIGPFLFWGLFLKANVWVINSERQKQATQIEWRLQGRLHHLEQTAADTLYELARPYLTAHEQGRFSQRLEYLGKHPPAQLSLDEALRGDRDRFEYVIRDLTLSIPKNSLAHSAASILCQQLQELRLKQCQPRTIESQQQLEQWEQDFHLIAQRVLILSKNQVLLTLIQPLPVRY